MLKNIVIPNPKKLEKFKRAIAKDGCEKIHILSDFDRTLTHAFVNGKNIPSLISILRDENYLTPDYVKKSHEFYNKYHPIEIDPEIPLEEKKRAMHEWWMTHFDLLIKSGLNKRDIEKIVESRKLRFREGFLEFADLLKAHNIPLVIMSSSGLGGDIISLVLEREGRLYDNIYIISNSFEWDENGYVIGIKEPIIHVLNKDETAIQDYPVFEIIKERKNVLLLGDNLEDTGMIKGFEYKNLIKIGFLNEEVEKNLEKYKQNFDILILNDSDMNYVNSLINEIIK